MIRGVCDLVNACMHVCVPLNSKACCASAVLAALLDLVRPQLDGHWHDLMFGYVLLVDV